MAEQPEPINDIQDIKSLMHKSSRFIGLSGWSGVAAGICALGAAVYTASDIECWKRGDCAFDRMQAGEQEGWRFTLTAVALITFAIAFALAFLFTYLRSRKTGVAVWGYTARKVMWNVALPMAVGGAVAWRLMDFGLYGLIAPACLIFYGLGLVNGSKFTVPEIRYLGYFQIALGVVNLWMIGYGLYFWAAGFGVLHIVYGIIMWNKYERNQ